MGERQKRRGTENIENGRGIEWGGSQRMGEAEIKRSETGRGRKVGGKT